MNANKENKEVADDPAKNENNVQPVKKSTKIASFTADQKAWLEDILSKDCPVEYIETGNVGLDLVLSDGKGLPIGSSTLFWARPGSGKQQLLLTQLKD